MIEIELDTPNGPIVEYGAEDDAESVEAAIPAGWRVSWDTPAYKLRSGRFRSPLVRPVGRPSRSASGNAAGQIKVRVTAEEATAFASSAGEQPVSAWLRDLGRKASGLDKRKR